jgi:hypothetical protein
MSSSHCQGYSKCVWPSYLIYFVNGKPIKYKSQITLPIISASNQQNINKYTYILFRGRSTFWGLKLTQFWGPSLQKRKQNGKYKIRYKSEYLFRAPSQGLGRGLCK